MTRRYEFRTAEGGTCCSTDNPEYLCTRCKAALKDAGFDDRLGSYAANVQELRAAQSITLNAIHDGDPRLRAMQERRASFYAIVRTGRAAAAQPAVGDVYTNPPDPYAIGLKKEAR